MLANASFGLRFNKHIEGDGPTVFAHACKLGLEGIVSKRKDSIYRSGRSNAVRARRQPAVRAAPAEPRRRRESTIFGTSVRPRAPPKAVPFQTRPVTSWKGRVAISAPAGATPMMMDWPQPRWQASSAWRMTVTLPLQSKV